VVLPVVAFKSEDQPSEDIQARFPKIVGDVRHILVSTVDQGTNCVSSSMHDCKHGVGVAAATVTLKEPTPHRATKRST
jgi:hypothetical protein